MNKLFLLALPLLLAGCIQSASPAVSTNESGGVGVKVAVGDTVSVDYVGSLDDKTVFDTSIKEEAVKAGLPLRPSYSPLEFVVGSGQVIKGFDDAVMGLDEGQERTVRIPPKEAYGEVKREMVIDVPRENIGGDVQKGSVLQSSNGMSGTVVNVTNTTVTIDFNHPLAGKALNFRIIVRKITKA